MKTDFKVGDWVVIKSYSLQYSSDHRGLVFQVLELESSTLSLKAKRFGATGNGFLRFLKRDIRLATENEIASIVEFRLRGYKRPYKTTLK